MNLFMPKRTVFLCLGFLLSFVTPRESAKSYRQPEDELGDFTLYNHGEIGKYNGYKGMLVGLYRVPRDVTVGTWMVKVKASPEGCSPNRQIHVHLQAGSLPLVNALGEAFPPEFLLHRFASQYRLQVANDASNQFLNITHPQPGEWFLIAYYIDTDTSIKQEGLTVDCNSILIVGLQFRTLNHIPELVFNDDRILEMQSKHPTMLYKIFVPESVISFSISVLNCTLISSESTTSKTPSSSGEPYFCPLLLSSRADALPYSNYELYNATTTTSSIGFNDERPLYKSCETTHLILDTQNQTYCTLVNEYPVRGTWHYLNITRTDKEEDTINSTVTFILHASGQDCFDIFRYDHSSIDEPGNRRGNSSVALQSKNETEAVVDDNANGLNRTHSTNTTTGSPPSSNGTDTLAKELGYANDTDAAFSTWVDSNGTALIDVRNSSAIPDSRTEFFFCPSIVEDLFKTEKENHFEYSFYPVRELTSTSSSQHYSCPGLCLRDTEVNFYSISVSPRDDVGGTLKISLAFHDPIDILRTTKGASQAQFVSVCITKDTTLLRSGGSGDNEEECVRGFEMNLDSTKDEKHEVVKWIPYPEPGKYFFKFSLRCVDASTIVDEDIRTGKKVPCAKVLVRSTRRMFDGLVLKFNVTSNACIERECGPYGSCGISYYDKVQFSYCICDDELGYRGYGCTEKGPNAPSYLVLVLNVVFLIGSNVAFLAAIVIGIKRGFYLEATVYLSVLFFSTFYHACDQPLFYYCIIKGSARRSYDLLQFMDFVSALFALWVTILAAAEAPLRFKLPVVVFGAILVPAMTYYNRFLLQTILVPLGLSIGVLAITWIVKCRRTRLCFPRRHYSLLHMLPSAICGIAGIACFTQATRQNYYIIHSLWHVLMAVAIACLLPCINRAGRIVDSNTQTDDEDDVCERGGGGSSGGMNVETDSSTTSGNGNGNGVSGSFFYGSTNADDRLDGANAPVQALSSSSTNEAVFDVTSRQNLIGKTPTSMLGRLLSREEEDGRN